VSLVLQSRVLHCHIVVHSIEPVVVVPVGPTTHLVPKCGAKSLVHLVLCGHQQQVRSMLPSHCHSRMPIHLLDRTGACRMLLFGIVCSGMVPTQATDPTDPTAVTPTPPASAAAPSTTSCQRPLASQQHPVCPQDTGGHLEAAVGALGWAAVP
jgi:hypothetical protein